jgi:cytidyltransferase-like protein
MIDGGATRPAEGLVIGKFYPLHAGHQLLVDTARAACDTLTLTVAVLAAARESIPLETRARWVRALWPDVRVVAAYDEAPMSLTDPGIWAMHVAVIQAAVGRPVDVFSSEAYGDELARDSARRTWRSIPGGPACR